MDKEKLNITEEDKKWGQEYMEKFGPKEDAEHWATCAHDTQKDFSKRLEETSGDISAKEFAKWEDDYSDVYQRMRDSEYKAGIIDIPAGIDLEKAAFAGIKPEESIDAYAGEFYNIRMYDLRKAIESAPEPSQEDLRSLGDFYRTVMEHVEQKYTTLAGMSSMEYERYLRDRVYAHDQAIKALNHLNSLTKKYHTRRFTTANFHTSDLRTSKSYGENGEDRSDFDRNIVEAFYNRAFASDIRKIERESGNWLS